jgi:predicted MFS family arabinose efflux permease
LVLGGWAVGEFGWRAAFLIAGLPGILLAAIYWLTVREPARKTDGPKELENLPSQSLFRTVCALSFIGQGIGPLAIGGLSDLLASRYGADGLRFAMIACGPTFLMPAFLFLIASRTLCVDAGLRLFSDTGRRGPD